MPITDFVRAYGTDHIAMVQVLFHIGGGCGTFDGRRYIDHQSESRASSDNGTPFARLSRAGRTLHSCGGAPVFPWVDQRISPPPSVAVVQRWDLSVILSGSPWPFPDYVTSSAAAYSGIESNVENGIGFIGGILRKDVMYESCELLNRPSTVTHCELTYDARSALLEGHTNLPKRIRAAY